MAHKRQRIAEVRRQQKSQILQTSQREKQFWLSKKEELTHTESYSVNRVNIMESWEMSQSTWLLAGLTSSRAANQANPQT